MITYTATNTRTGQFYIGSTINFKKRQQDHLFSKAPFPFQSALRKNPDEWEWDFVEDDREDRELEQFLLDLFWGTKGCLNLAADATAPMEGQKHTPETIEKLRSRSTGRTHSAETRAKISEGNKGLNPLKGRKFPDRRGVPRATRPEVTRRVEVTSPSGEKREFDTLRQATEVVSCRYGTLQKWVQFGRTVRSGAFKGFSLRYL